MSPRLRPAGCRRCTTPCPARRRASSTSQEGLTLHTYTLGARSGRGSAQPVDHRRQPRDRLVLGLCDRTTHSTRRKGRTRLQRPTDWTVAEAAAGQHAAVCTEPGLRFISHRQEGSGEARRPAHTDARFKDRAFTNGRDTMTSPDDRLDRLERAVLLMAELRDPALAQFC